MSKAVYIATSEPESGKSIVSLGLMRMILGRTKKVAYFRPIIGDKFSNKRDNHIDTMLTHFDLELEYEECFAMTGEELIHKKTEGKDGEILDIIIEKYKSLEERFDFILVEGTDFSGEGLFVEMDINILIAKNLGIPVIIVSNGKNKNKEEIEANVRLAYDEFNDKEVKVLAVVANKVQPNLIDVIQTSLKRELPDNVFVYSIPLINTLEKPTVQEIVDEMGAKVLIGKRQLNNQTGSFAVGAMQLRNFLKRVEENSLVITPGDRADIILSSIQANNSENYPKISGIVLTGGLKPEKGVLKLIKGLSDVVPIISVKSGTFEAANKIGSIRSHIYANNRHRIYNSLSTFDKFVNIEDFSSNLIAYQPEGMTPRMFQFNLVTKAKKDKKHIVLPEGTDERIIRAAARIIALNIAEITLLGDESEIKKVASKYGIPLDFEKVHVVKPCKSDLYKDYVKTFYELRKHKNVNMDIARDTMADVSYFGTMMVYKGHADGMVSGAIHTTQHTIRPALQFIKTKPGVSVVSSVFFMCLEDRVSVFGDCAINPNPTAEQLAEIAISSAQSSKAFGIEPKVAMLSYSSGSSGKGEDVERVRKATEIVKKLHPEIKIEGPIQYDAAVDMGVGKIKLPDSEVAGQASVLIFPDLNTGNNTYKAVQRETGAIAIGPMLQGLNKPVNDLSRGCTVDDVFNTVVITAIQAQL